MWRVPSPRRVAAIGACLFAAVLPPSASSMTFMTEDSGVLGDQAGSILAARGYEAARYMGATRIRHHRGLEPLGDSVNLPASPWATTSIPWQQYKAKVDNWLIDVEYRGLTPYLTLSYQPGKWTMPAPGSQETAFVTGFERFCTAAAQAYNGRIMHYGVWNEPNNDVWGRGSNREHNGSPRGLDTYPALYNTIYRRCYDAIKAVNPQMKVYYGEIDAHKSGACSYVDSSLWHATDTDGIAIHTYQWSAPPEQAFPGSTQCQAIGRLDEWNTKRATWDAANTLDTPTGGAAPIHITEHGYCPWFGECPNPGHPQNSIPDEDVRADFARRSFLWAKSKGVQTFSYYHLFNLDPATNSWDTGIISWDGTWRQSVHALRDAAVWWGSQPDFSGDGKPDVLARQPNGELFMHRSNRAGSWLTNSGEWMGSGWAQFDRIVSPGDFDGDAKADVLARRPDGKLFLYTGNGAGAWQGVATEIGTGWEMYDRIVAPGDFNGDLEPDVLARKPDGTLWLYRGDGAGKWIDGNGGIKVGEGWQQYDTIVAPGDFNGDRMMDVIARKPDGTLWLYRGDGAGKWIDGNGSLYLGAGWDQYDALLTPGDFSGDGKPDLLGRRPDGTLWMYRSDGTGKWIDSSGGVQVGAGWSQYDSVFAVGR